MGVSTIPSGGPGLAERCLRAAKRPCATFLYLARNPSYALLFLAAKANLPRICGAVLVACIQRVSRSKAPSSGGIRMLVLKKSVFMEDVAAIADQIENVELFLLGRTHLHFVAKAFFRKGTNDNNYHDLATADIVDRYRRFLTVMWKFLNGRLKVRCALSGNFSYFEERELAYVAEFAGVPFIVVHKECMKTPGRIDEYEHLYRSNKGPFWGSLILVYNEIERDLIVRTSVTSAEKVKVVGMPRLDVLHKARLGDFADAPERTVLLISFHKDLNTLDDANGNSPPNLKNIWESVHLAMFELARRRPEIKVVIKTKGDHKDIAWIADLVERHSLSLNMPNLKVVHGGQIRELLLSATAVCGVHSTALLEALAANKPVIIPAFEELAGGTNDRHLIDFGNTVTTATSKKEFMDRLETELVDAPLLRPIPEETRSLLRYWLGNDDGGASERAAAEIRKLIGS